MENPSETIPLKIAVASLTRRRPNMISNLIGAWAALEFPKDCEIRFLFVENDETENTKGLIKDLAGVYPNITLDYAFEPEIGISFARNAAARLAIAKNSDWLVFVDDDEVVARDWLVKLADGLRKTNAVLVGALLRVDQRFYGQGFLEKLMHENLARRYARKERLAARKASLCATPGVATVTNNWAARTHLFTTEGIWFDESLRHTGGSDVQFYSDVVSRGLPTGWVADAFAYESIPRERLSIRYQFRRGRDQATANFRRKFRKNPKKLRSLVIILPIRLLLTVVAAVSVPLTGGRTLLTFCRSAGWVFAKMQAVLGRDSKLYFEVTGN